MTTLLIFVKRNWIALTLFLLAAITTLSLWPSDELPSVPGTDKTHHLISYALLTFPSAFRKPDRWMLFGLFFIAYGGAIELLQPLVNRHGDWLDLLANTGGVVCGFIAAGIVNCFYSAGAGDDS